MVTKPESRLQRRIHRALEKRFNAKFFKVWGGPFMDVGLGDLVGCIDGLFFMLEVKRDAKDSEPSEIQLETLAQYRKAGAFACVIVSVAEAFAVVRAAKRLSKEGRRLRVEPTGGRPILRPEDWEDLDRARPDRTNRTRRRAYRLPVD